MQYVITIDTGTTNTRVMLWDEASSLAASAQAAVGVRNTAIDGHNRRLKAAVHDCLEQALEQAGIGYEQVQSVIASGMITSNVGLVEVPHVTAPAGLDDLAANARSILLPEVCPLPILFIPGVKNALERVDLDNFEQMDIMRGEEVEAYAILDAFPAGQPYLLVLPGSHTKFVAVDEAGRITGCLTTITGELLASITHDTIIADAVGRSFVNNDTYDSALVQKGFATATSTGLARACFSARILNQFALPDRQKVANYCLGVALAGDVAAVKGSDAIRVPPRATVIVGGKDPLRRAIAEVLQSDRYFTEVIEYEPAAVMPLAASGAVRVAARYQQKKGGNA